MRFWYVVMLACMLVGTALSLPAGSETSFLGYSVQGQVMGYTGASDGVFSAWVNPALYGIARPHTGFSLEGLGARPTYRFEGGIPTALGQIGGRFSLIGSDPSPVMGELLWSRAISRWFSLGAKLSMGVVQDQGFFSLDLGMMQRGGEAKGVGFLQWDYGVVLRNMGLGARLADGTLWRPFGIVVGGGFSPVVYDAYEWRLQSDVSVAMLPWSVSWGIGMQHTLFGTVMLAGGYQMPFGQVGLSIGGGYTLGLGLRAGFALDRRTTNLLVRPGKTPSSDYTEVEIWYGVTSAPRFSQAVMVNVAWGQYDDRPPVIQTNAVVFFSPNTDGVKDVATIPLLITDNGKLSGWEVEIVDGSSRVVRTFQSWQTFESREISFKRVMERLFVPDRGVEVPPALSWDGRDSGGKLLPDGVYRYRIRARDLSGNETTSPWNTIVLDTATRQVGGTLSSSIFSPNGDGIQDVLTVTLSPLKSLEGDTLSMVVKSAAGERVFQSVWTNENGLPTTLVWDGKSGDRDLPEGNYTITVALESEAGNQASVSWPVRMVRTMEQVSLTSSTGVFSARKGDVVVFRPRVSREELLTNWMLVVEDERGRPVWHQRGIPPLPAALSWDGRDERGRAVPDGTYQARLSLWYESGNQPISDPVSVRVDNTPPSLAVKLPYTIFSPLPDSRQRTLPIDFSLEAASNDVVTLRIMDEGGRVVFYDQNIASAWPKSLEWTGLQPTLDALPEGRYTLVAEAVDAAGNDTRTNVVVTLRTGREKIALTTPAACVSPRLSPEVPFFFEGSAAGVRSFEFVLQDEKNQVAFALRTNGWVSSLALPITNLADGIYTATAVVLYEDGQNPRSRPYTIEVDSVPPSLFPSVDKPAFSPNGDGRRDVLVITTSPQGRSSDGYRVSILDTSGREVRSWSWLGTARSQVVWNGQDSQGRDLPEGVYTLQAKSTDAASNLTVEWISNIQLVRRYPELRFEVESAVIDPAVSPLRIIGQVTETSRLERNEIEILNQQGETVYRMATNTWVGTWLWRGEASEGSVPDGYYTVRWNLTYIDGNAIQAQLEDLIVDREAPRLSLAFSPAVFTPDGDGENDEMRLRMSVWDLAGLSSWRATIAKIRENGSLLPIKQWSGALEDEPSLWEQTLTWDGKGDDGELVESVQDYLVSVMAVDVLGHTNTSQTNFTTGVLVERTPDGLRIRMSSIRFAVNSSTLSPQSRQILNRVIEVFQRLFSHPERYGLTRDWFVEVSGHTDDLPGPTADFNQKLSERRARAVYEYLVSQGIPAEKLSWAGYGETRPYKKITPSMTRDEKDEVRSRNRRVEFFIRKR